MPLNVTLEFPEDIEDRVRRDAGNLNSEVKDAFVIELFRRGKLSHFDLSRVLGFDRFETDTWLKRHRIFDGSLTMEDLEVDREALQVAMGKTH